MMSDTICMGSHLNQRTFKEDEYWESFQSTLISGQILSADHHDETSVELSTMIEDEMSEENTLNMNLDVIPDADPDDMFFDCPSFEKSPANLVRNPMPLRIIMSPRPYSRPQFYTVQFSSPPENEHNSSRKNISCEASPRKQRPESARRISPARTLTTTTTSPSDLSSSPSHAGMRTGSLLVEIARDFNDLKDHAQSTPMLSSDSGNPSSGSLSEELASSRTSNSVESVRKTLDFHNADTLIIDNNKQADEDKPAEVSITNKENFFNGKYSKFVATRRGSEKPSPLRTRAGKVKLLAGFFQSFAIESANIKSSLSKSRIPLPVRKSSQLLSHVKKSPQAKARASGSPTYQTKKSYKLLSSRSSSSSSNTNTKSHPATATTFSSSGSESFLTRNQRKFPARTMRVQSCSDATNAEILSIDETCKSHSDGDLHSRTTNSSTSIKTLDVGQSNKRTYLIAKKNSPMKKFSPAKKVSAINNRRSVGAQLKKNVSPVKPVKELCKLFTPKRNTGKKTQNTLVVPKIVITHQ